MARFLLSNFRQKGGCAHILSLTLVRVGGVSSFHSNHQKMSEILKSRLEGTNLPTAKKMKIDVPKCVLRYAKLTEHAMSPVRGSDRAAGVDLRSAYDITIPARGKEVVKTDLQVQVPEGAYGRVAPRSGLAVKNFIDVGAGVVDEDYRGNLGVVLFNHSDTDFEVKRGDRIAQFICERIFYPELEEVDKLEGTVRGEGGFGSTGLKEMAAKNGESPMAVDDETNGAAKGEKKAEDADGTKAKAKASEEDTANTPTAVKA